MKLQNAEQTMRLSEELENCAHAFMVTLGQEGDLVIVHHEDAAGKEGTTYIEPSGAVSYEGLAP